MTNLPPTAVWTCEFDMYKRDNLAYADKLKQAGKLLGLSNMPGVTQNYHLTYLNAQESKWFFEEE